ncbi:MAG: tetratricopeptide repeat protein [Pseudomonadota bacterium]
MTLFRLARANPTTLRTILLGPMLFVLLAACGPSIDLPELPAVDTSALLADVADQLDANRARVEKSPGNATLAGRYGLVLATYGRDEAADVAFQRARLLEPDEARWAFYHAFVLRRLSQPDAALSAIEAGLSAQPDQIDLVVKRGELLFDLARFDEAEANFDQALNRNPKYPLAQYYKGRIHMTRSEWPEAIKRFENMIQDGILVNEVHFNLATAYRMNGDAALAEEQLALSQGDSQLKIAGFDPVNMKFDTLNVGDQPHVLRAARHYRSGNLNEAIAELRLAFDKNPNNAATHANLIRMYGQSRQLDKAIEHHELGKAIDPNYALLDSNMGFAYASSGDFANAVDALTRAAEQSPNDAAIQAELGFALGKTGRLDEGIERMQQSLELNANNRDLRFILGEAMVKQRRFPEAIQLFESAFVPGDPKTVAIMRALARTHMLSSNPSAAAATLTDAIELADSLGKPDMVEALEADLERVTVASSPN